MPIPTFQTERLLLRGVTLADAPSYQKNFADWEVIRELGLVVPWPYPPDGARAYIESHILPSQGKDKWVWGIFLREQPAEIVGVVDLWRQGHPENRGFWLARRHWGLGLMTEAVTPVMDYAFDVLGFDTLVFANARGNARSRRVKEKTGARLIRVEPRAFVNPHYTESEVWELTKADWQRWKASAQPDPAS